MKCLKTAVPLRQDVSQVEFIIYSFTWFSAVIYSIYCFTVSSNKRFQHIDDEFDFTHGWSLLNRKKDIADFEWRLMKLLMKSLFPWLIVSTVISEILRHFRYVQTLQYIQIFISVLFILKEFGVWALGIILVQPSMFALTLIISRKKSHIWICNIIAFLLIILFKSYSFNEEFLNAVRLNDETFYLTMIAISWMNLRCISCCIDSIDTKDERLTIFTFLSYCLYLPTLVSGPFIPYKDFKGCYEFKNNLKTRFLMLVANVFRFLFWWLLVEFFLHFIYVSAVGFHPNWVKSFDSWALYGYGYTMGQFFHMKYLISYGLMITVAKFENIGVPTLPVCIGRIHLYSDMWKYFDAGLYKFLLRYIYIPLMKNFYIKNRLFSSFMCFIFVYIWHGTEYYILIWTILNYLGIAIEQCATWFHNMYLQRSKFYKETGCRWARRLTCIASAPLLAMSAISNFYFFAGAEIGSIFMMRFLTDKIWTTTILILILYTCCQVSTEIRSNLNSSKNHKTS